MEVLRSRRIVAALVIAGLTLCSAAALAEPVVKQSLHRASVTTTGRSPEPREVRPVDPRLQRPEVPPLFTPPPPPSPREWTGWLKQLGGMLLGALH